MTTYVAIEQSKTSLMVAIAEKRATGVAVVDGARSELPASAGPEAIESALRKRWPELKWSRAELVVVVGGDDTQLRRLELPPAPSDELPGMVRMLSGKELGATEDDAIDFLPVDGGEHGNVVVAARLAEERLREAEDLAKRLDASLDRIVLRPCASAALVTELTKRAATGPQLIVTPALGGADLVALRNGTPVLIRSTLGSAAEALQTDIRRTLPVASQLLGGPPELVVVVGNPAGESQLSTPAGELTMQVVDLSKESMTAQAFRGVSESDQAALVGVIGAAVEAVGGERSAIDFANPRGAESGHSDRRRQFVLAGVAAASIVAGLLMMYGRLVSLDQQIADLEASAKRFDESTETLRPYEQQTQRLDAWAATDVTWLDEIEQLGRRLRPELVTSRDYPAAEDVYLTELLLRPPPGGEGAGQIEFRAAARSPSVPGLVEQRLSDDWHSIQPISVTERPGDSKYTSKFQTFVSVAKQPEETPDAQASEATSDEAKEGTDE